MPSATKNATAVDAGSIREDMWNFGDEVGLDEFLSNIPDGDGVSALGGVEKGKKDGNGLGNWDVLDEALGADIQSSAPVEVPGKKKSPPSSDLRPETPMGAHGDSGFGGSPGADRDSNGSHGGSGPGASKSAGSGGSGSGYVGSADDRGEAALDGLAKLSTALEMVRSQQIGAGNAHMGEVPDISMDAGVLLTRLQKMLESVSQCVKLGSLVQMFVPKVDNSSGAVTLVTHRALARVSSMHDKKFWQYHKVSESFFFSLSPSSSEGLLGLPGRCFLYGRTEWTTSVCCYRPMEYPRLQCAIECQVNSTLVVPLFISNSVSEEIPFAVVEIVMDRQTMLPGTLFETVAAAIRSHGFYTCDTSSLGSPATMRKVVADTVDSLCESNSQALAHMCRSLGMLLAQCWLPDSTGEFLIASGAPFCMGDVMTLPYRQLSEQITLRRGQGPVGRAMEKGGIIWVDDVQNGSQVEWPLHHATALLGLHGMCACRVLVQKKDGEKTEAVLELYFPGNLKTPEQQQPCVDAIWNHLHGSSTVSMYGSAGDSENPGAGGQPIPTDISNLDPFCGSLPDINAPNFGVAGPAGDAKPPWGITLEMLQKHFSKHLKEAAKDLGVGSTTLKRICRHFGISRWPRRSLKSKQGRLQNALKTLSAEGALPPGQFGIHASGTYMGQPGTSAFNDGLDTDSPGGSMHGGSSYGGSMHGGSSYGGSMHAALNFPPVAQSFGGSAHAGAAFGGGGAMGGAMGGAAGGSTRAGSNLGGLKRDSGGAAFGHGGGGKARGVSWHGGDGALRMMARNEYVGSGLGPGADGGGLNIPSANPMRGNSFHGANGGHFGASPTGFPGMMNARNGSFGGGGASPGRGAGGSGDFGGMWNSCEGAGTSLGLEEGGGGGRAHGGSAARSLLRQSNSAHAREGGSMAEDFLAVNGNGAAPNLAALTVKVSVSNGDNVRFKLLPGMAYADVQARLRESIEGQVGDLRLRYQDEDDEWCALNGDSDLAECIQVCQSRGMVRMQAAR
tara:strand:+ start:4777 stop:7809 length:3033 start_codon:yes stop_codon:yes gene_type:complete